VPDIPRPQLLGYVALAVVVGLLGVRYLRSPGPPASSPVPAGTIAAHGSPVEVAPGGRSAVVDVAGAVRRPGVYTLPAGARVLDAVRRAGGARHGAQLAAINLAARLVDGQQIVVPQAVVAAAAGAGTPGGGAAAAADAAPGGPPSAPISLGSATPEQLETLDGVGPATAQKIVAYRTEHGGFRSVDDLANVPGIGPKKLAAIRPHVQP
jgi:competence protein ComEA